MRSASPTQSPILGFGSSSPSPPPLLRYPLRRHSSSSLQVALYSPSPIGAPISAHRAFNLNRHSFPPLQTAHICIESSIAIGTAMSVEDDLTQGFVSSIASNNFNHISDLSPEDAAWVDSCLVKNPELSESSWDPVKECLLDIISSDAHSNFSTSVVENGSLETSSSRDVLMSEEAETTQGHVAAKYGDAAAKADKEEMDLIRGFLLKDMSKFCDQQQGDLEGDMAELGLDLSHTSSMDVLMGNEAGKSQSHVAVDDHEPFKALEFLGDEKEDSVSEKDEMSLFRGFLLKNKSKIRVGKQDNKVAEVDLDMNQTDEIEQLPEDIFKVWDLETPVDEEDELVKQLEEALTESSLTTQPLADSLRNHIDTGALDSLISGIADLSLQSISGF